MFKFIKQYAEKMDHAQVYPMISLLIFFLFFVVLLVYVKRMDKGSTAALSNIPLNENSSPVEQQLK
jgi:cytochrome c oxidase cbb3-type subunit IV